MLVSYEVWRPMMATHSMTYWLIFLVLAILLIGGLYLVTRSLGAKSVASDHTADPRAPRADGFGAADRQRAIDYEGRDDPELPS